MHLFRRLGFLTVIILFSISLFAQQKCGFKIDTAKILSNQNLDSFLSDMRNESFVITNNKSDIPRFIKTKLKCFAHGFRIANPDEPYNATDDIVRNLPRRQLTFLAKSKDLLVMRYAIGGIGTSYHLLLIKFDHKKITDLWKGLCWWDIKTINDVVSYIDSNRNKGGHLNTRIYF